MIQPGDTSQATAVRRQRAERGLGVRAGQTWYGFNHGSVWMVFDSDVVGLFDLWCINPRGAPSYHFGSILTDRTARYIVDWFDQDPPTRFTSLTHPFTKE